MARTARKSKPSKPASRPRMRKVAKALRDDDALHGDNAICACDCDFSESEATPDDLLPAARGG